jgi:hypothetical protein
MPFLIKQGKQDTSQDGKFNPIVCKDVFVEVQELKAPVDQVKYPSSVEVTLRVVQGDYKNRFVSDRVSYDPQSPNSWKYRALRAAAGVPYQEGEPEDVDLELLLLHQVLKVDLGTRKGKNKNNEDTDFQSITYKKPEQSPAAGVGADVSIIQGSTRAVDFDEDVPPPTPPAPVKGDADFKEPAPAPTPEVVVKPEPKPEVKPEPKPEVKPEVKVEAKPSETSKPTGPVISDDDDWA